MKLAERLLPDTLGGRIVVVLLVGLLAFHLGSLWLHQAGTEALLGTTREAQLAERLVAAKRAIAALPAEERDKIAAALSSPSLALRWARTVPATAAGDAGNGQLQALRVRLSELVTPEQLAGLRLGDVEAMDGAMGRHHLPGALPLSDGSWLWFSATLSNVNLPEHATLLSSSAMAVGILVVSLLVVRLIGRPLRALSDAADRVGGDRAGQPMAETGPREVRHAAQAFNRMQARIDRLITDRTQALAAVSHDLRTPIARLRLRAGFIEDPEAAQAIDRDLDEMEAMIDGTLAYLRGEADGEDARAVDLVAMLETLCDEASDRGGSVGFTGPPLARLIGRPLTLRRAFGNLIDNALKYAGAAQVSVEDRGASVVVVVEDDGPGIPEGLIAAAFEPFRRLEASRNRGTGGSGLGLTIARRGVETHGGQLLLENRAQGGLRATVTLPRSGS